LKKYNTHLKATVLPQTRYGYEISLPVTAMSYFNENRVAILDSASKRHVPTGLAEESTEAVLASSTLAEPTEDGTIVIGRPVVAKAAATTSSEDYVNVTRKVKKIHKVRRGEVMNKIALRYGVSVNDIKKWNGKTSSKI